MVATKRNFLIVATFFNSSLDIVAKTRFRQDSFIEHIEFDYLEIQVIEED